MRIEIDAEGKHEPLPHMMTVDLHSILVDLRSLPGPFRDDPGDGLPIARITWDESLLDERNQVGEIMRRQPGNPRVGRQAIFLLRGTDGRTMPPTWLQGYLEAYNAARLAAGT